MAIKKNVRFGGMKIFPDDRLMAVVGVAEKKVGKEILALPDAKVMSQIRREGLDPAQLTKRIWMYIKGNKLLKSKGKKASG